MDRGSGRNITAQILALILAIGLWIYVTNDQNPPVETSLTVPVETRNVADPLIAVDAPDTVRVKVRGSRSLVAGLQGNDIKAYVDLVGLLEGRHNLKVAVQVPNGIELLEVLPDKVSIRLDNVVSRKLPVEIRLTGTAASGTAVSKVTASAEQVTVEGPESSVESVDKAILYLDLTGKNADFTVNVTPVPISRDGKEVAGLTLYPNKVEINASLVRGLNQKTVDIKTITYGDLAAGMVLKSLTTKPEKVEISGDPQVLDKIEFVYTEPINVAGIAKDTTREVRLQLKEGIVASQNAVIVQINVGAGR